MSVFGDNREDKNNLLTEILDFSNNNKDKDLSDVIEDLMEVISYGISTMVSERE